MPHTDDDLIRAIRLPTAVLFVVGSVVGSGIFLTTGVMAETLPSTALLLLAWTLGGLFALAGGLSYAEMGAMFPRSGGVYVFLREAYGPLPAFLYGWVALLVVISGGIAAVAVGFAEYLSYFLPSVSASNVLMDMTLGGVPVNVSAAQLVAGGSVLLLGAINYVGVRSGNMTNAVMTMAKIAGLAALPVLALFAHRATPDLAPVVPSDLVRPFASFGVAMIAVLWTYEAWYFITYAAGEIEDPKRNVPRALAIGVMLLTTIYLSVNVAYFFALPLDRIRGVTRIAEEAAVALVGPPGARFVAATVVVSTFGCNAAAVLAGSRLLFAMSRDGVFFRSASEVHPRFRTPHVAIVAMTLWSTLLTLSGTYEQLFTYVMFSSVLFSVFGGLALFRLRRLLPHHPRPYRAWGYPWVPALFVAGSIAFVWNTLVERPFESLAGLGLLALGLPAYWYWHQRGTVGRDR
ncbi:MAG TPA: APC family permease [Vicinamibacterales bacterium]|nr:APC family permease [Vicinamibacterales bacterium]